MKYLKSIITIFILCFHSVAYAKQLSTWLLTDISLIDTSTGEIASEASILIKGNRIAAINPIELPEGIKTVSGKGRYVIPGLSEMHAHIPNNPEYTDRVLKLFIAHGVTNIRGMLGHPSHLALREQLNSGNKLGPYLVTSGPSINGNSVQSPQQAIKKITQQVKAGYDFHKIHPGLSKESYRAVTETASNLGSLWGGHISTDVGIVDTVKAGQATIDHLDGFIEELAVRNGGEIANRGFFGFSLAHQVNDNSIAKLITELKPYDYSVVPTETLMQNLAGSGSTDQLMKNPAHRWMPKSVVDGWKNSRDNFWSNPAITKQQADRFLQVRRILLNEFQKQGVPILLGSDAPQWFNVPGDSLHKELELMVESGLTPLQALQTGTHNIFAYYRRTHSVGIIKEGLRADLILLNKNPLESISNSRSIHAVVVAGQFLDRDLLDSLLANLE